MRTIQPEFYLALASGHATYTGVYVLSLGTSSQVTDIAWAVGTATAGALFVSTCLRAPHRLILVACLALTILMSSSVGVAPKIAELHEVMARPFVPTLTPIK